MSELDRFNRLIARGSEYRHETLAALYEVWQRVEAVSDDAPPAIRQLCRVVGDFICAMARAEELGAYMGKTKTDCYGIVVDIEVGHTSARRWIKWRREVPHRHLSVPVTQEQAVRIGAAVDRHRTSGHLVQVHNLPVLLGDVMEPVDEAIREAAEHDRDRDELLAILADALEAQSMERVLILAESFPDHPRQVG